ncbi:flagella associated protein [Chrysochromulina tobinii]|uniref:Flagella associated protein n=1 Tax=Chrysochromulina tobinii TaxID=1460289 RepID=A0A0M0LP32_9EUKA|nr:flagella associated protein [Chrysochromulina tobinii]|eukprot:KOO52804.1 flagella associated protein [Chrysochromulina sp. CCMP291]
MAEDFEEFDDLPEFANEPNRALHRQLKEHEKAVVVVENELVETKERIGTMEEHLSAVNTETLHTQRLIDAKVKEIETEDHLKQLAERERGRFQAEYKKLQAELAELHDKVNGVQVAVFKGNEKMDQFKLQMNWNQEELEQWALAARQKEEDNLALLKYSKADEAKMKDLSLQLEKMLAAVQKKKAELEDEVTDTQAAQIELDKTAEDFRKLHEERGELVSQWEEAVVSMQKRDEAIQRAHEQFSVAKRQLREKQEVLAEREAFLLSEQKNNVEVENKITALERSVAKSRETLTKANMQLREMEDQVETVRGTLSKAASEMANKKVRVAELSAQIDERKRRLDEAKKKLAQNERSLERSHAHMGDLEKSAKQMDEISEQEKIRLKQTDKELAVLKDKMFNEGQKLFALRQQEAHLLSEISGAQRVSRNASAKLKQLDERSQGQRELVYAADFQLQLMERKVARASGVRSPMEQKELHAKIAELTEECERYTAQHRMLNDQYKRLINDVKQTKRIAHEKEQELEKLEGQISETEMKTDAASRALKKLIKEKEQSMVAFDVLKLEGKRLREQLNAKADEVFGLTNRKFQLQMSMEERQEEIKVHSDVLRAQLKAAEEERHAAARELANKLIKVERLTSKYDIICGKLGDGGDGEHTQAYYVIKAAQEREELQRQGDELDQQIQKAEREIKALEKTLQHLFAKNAGYKRSFAPVEQNTPQFEQKVLLEEQHRAALSKYRTHRLEQSELEEEMARMADQLAELDDQKARLSTQLMDLSDQSEQLEERAAQQLTKLEGAKAQVRRMLNEQRQRGAGEALELELALIEQRSTNRALIEALTAIAANDPKLAMALETKMAQAGVQPPAFDPELDDDDEAGVDVA